MDLPLIDTVTETKNQSYNQSKCSNIVQTKASMFVDISVKNVSWDSGMGSGSIYYNELDSDVSKSLASQVQVITG